jgi:hypothetical protein
MRAITGVRQRAIVRIIELVQATKRGRKDCIGMRPKARAEIGAPTRMKGMRRPILVRTRSDQAPTGGWMKRAAMLSSVMKKPINAKSEALGEKDRHEGVVDPPEYGHPEESEAEKKDPAVTELVHALASP